MKDVGGWGQPGERADFSREASTAETLENMKEKLLSFALRKIELLRAVRRNPDDTLDTESDIYRLQFELQTAVPEAIERFEKKRRAIDNLRAEQHPSEIESRELKRYQAELESEQEQYENDKRRLLELPREIDACEKKLSNLKDDLEKSKAELRDLKATEEEFRAKQDVVLLLEADKMVLADLVTESVRFGEMKDMARDGEFFEDVEALATNLYGMGQKLGSEDWDILRNIYASLSPTREQGVVSHNIKLTTLHLTGKLPAVEYAKETLRVQRMKTTLMILESMTNKEAQKFKEFQPEAWMESREFRQGVLSLWYDYVEYNSKNLESFQDAGCGKEIQNIRQALERFLIRAGLVVSPIIIGNTVFDSSKHIARSTSTIAGMRDGVISGVVKLGLLDRDSEQVLQQPEVIVNRI